MRLWLLRKVKKEGSQEVAIAHLLVISLKAESQSIILLNLGRRFTKMDTDGHVMELLEQF